jgi:metal-responsive CopG/Arc/MetJ family transcriptional regulator
MKTAVSIPDPVFRAADQMARRLNVSRSELYRRALVRMLEQEDDASITARLDELYAAEDSTLDPMLAEMQRVALGDWE